ARDRGRPLPRALPPRPGNARTRVPDVDPQRSRSAPRSPGGVWTTGRSPGPRRWPTGRRRRRAAGAGERGAWGLLQGRTRRGAYTRDWVRGVPDSRISRVARRLPPDAVPGPAFTRPMTVGAGGRRGAGDSALEVWCSRGHHRPSRQEGCPNMSQPLHYLESDEREPHISRGRRLLKEHPEVRELIGPTRWTAFWVVALVSAQIGLAALMADQVWWAKLLGAWCVGAFLTHGLWVLIHEPTHHLVFQRPRGNAPRQLLATLPTVSPAAIGFRKSHLLHHRYQGDPELDADLASDWEARLIGNGFFGKAFWLFNFWLFQALRVTRFKKVHL